MIQSLDVFKHLNPRGKGWTITSAKPLRSFFAALSWVPDQIRRLYDEVWLDQFAATTHNLSAHEFQWGLPGSAGLTEAQRRTRLAARQREIGGQGPDYLQATLQAAGFDVWVFPWFEDPAEVPPVSPTVRDPRDYIADAEVEIQYLGELGEPGAECGEEAILCGATEGGIGYLLVNKITWAEPRYLVDCGEAFMECGEAEAALGNFDKFIWSRRIYHVDDDPATWRGYVYVGGEVFGAQAFVPYGRKDEFEDLVLRLFPRGKWIGLMVTYN